MAWWYDKALEVKKMAQIMDKLQKETENTEIESVWEYGFCFKLNVAWDIISVDYEWWKYFEDDWNWQTLAKDMEQTLKKIVKAIKNKRLEITEKYKKQLDSQKKGFRWF